MADGGTPGFELPLLLLAGFRTLIDELHAELARQGHPDMRPAHGFAMQAIGTASTSSSEAGRRLGVSKQAAGKTIDRLTEIGYAERRADPGDGRRKLVRLTPRGLEALALSARIFDDLHAEWARRLGPERLRELETDLRTMSPPGSFRLDVSGWFGALPAEIATEIPGGMVLVSHTAAHAAESPPDTAAPPAAVATLAAA